MTTPLNPITILQDARKELMLDDSAPFNRTAYWVLCAAISHLIGGRPVSTVDMLGIRD